MMLCEKEMATHSSVLAWRIPGAGEPALSTLSKLSLLGTAWHGLDLSIDLSPATTRLGEVS